MDENSKVRKLGDFAEAETFNASDVLFAEQNGNARKLPGSVLQKFCQDSIQTLVTAVQRLAQTTAVYEIKARESAAMASENANTASRAADSAENARDAIVNMEVTAETLETGKDAYATKSYESGKFHISFGLPRGERGAPFSIAKIYKSVSEMQLNYATDGVRIGGFVLIDSGNVEDPDNAKLFVKTEVAYSFLTDLSGAQGIEGPQGVQGPKGEKGDKGDPAYTQEEIEAIISQAILTELGIIEPILDDTIGGLKDE